MFIANASSIGPTAAPPRTAKAFGCMAAAEASERATMSFSAGGVWRERGVSGGGVSGGARGRGVVVARGCGVGASLCGRPSRREAQENFVDAAFAHLDADDQTPTTVPTTYPTPSRRCYRYADGVATYYAACGEDEPFLVVGAVAEYRGACVNEDAVDACLAAARCSIIDAEDVGPPDDCGDTIKGRVHRV